MITTSSFTGEARSYVANIEKEIVLIDGLHLARLMFDCGIGVTQAAPPFVLKRVDLDFFDEG